MFPELHRCSTNPPGQLNNPTSNNRRQRYPSLFPQDPKRDSHQYRSKGLQLNSGEQYSPTELYRCCQPEPLQPVVLLYRNRGSIRHDQRPVCPSCSQSWSGYCLLWLHKHSSILRRTMNSPIQIHRSHPDQLLSQQALRMDRYRCPGIHPLFHWSTRMKPIQQ